MNIDQFAEKAEVTHTRETRRRVEIERDDIGLVMRQAFAEKWGVRADQLSIHWYVRHEEFDGLVVTSVITETEEG